MTTYLKTPVSSVHKQTTSRRFQKTSGSGDCFGKPAFLVPENFVYPFWLESEDFSPPVWPTVHTYPVQTVTYNASFKNTLHSGDFFETPFCCTRGRKKSPSSNETYTFGRGPLSSAKAFALYSTKNSNNRNIVSASFLFPSPQSPYDTKSPLRTREDGAWSGGKISFFKNTRIRVDEALHFRRSPSSYLIWRETKAARKARSGQVTPGISCSDSREDDLRQVHQSWAEFSEFVPYHSLCSVSWFTEGFFHFTGL